MSHSEFIYSMKCIDRFGMYADHALYIRPSYVIESRTWDVRCAYANCAVDTQWSGSHTRHHAQWHRHTCTICAACALPIRRGYAVDTQQMQNSSAGDVPPNRICSFSRTPYERRGIAGQWNRGIRQVTWSLRPIYRHMIAREIWPIGSV